MRFRRAGAVTYRLNDGLGSTVALANSTGAVADSWTYDVFGAVRSHTGADTEFTFTRLPAAAGRRHDPNGLEYPSAASGQALRARY